MKNALEHDLDRQIAMTHQRFVTAMDARLPTMGLETKERYFVALGTLVTRLADTEKPLRDVLQETMAEIACIVMQELSS